MKFSNSRNRFKFRRIKNFLFFIALIVFGLSFLPLQAQVLNSVYLSEFKSGDSIYVISNRQPTDSDKNGVYFENIVRTEVELDFLKVRFYQPDSIFTQRLNPDDFLKQISAFCTDWLLFVHGDSKTFNQAVMRGFDIQHLHNLPVLVFSWPTKDYNISGIKNFKNSKNNIGESKDHFNKLLNFMEVFRNNNRAFADSAKLNLLLHSLGNSFIEQFINEKMYDDFSLKIFDNVILNSAAVNQKNHKDWLEQLNIQQQIYVTCNKSDVNLKGVRLFTKAGKQLGEKVKTPLAQNANYIHFTKAVGFRLPTGTTHTFFIGEVTDESKNIAEFYNDLFHGKRIDFSESERFLLRKDGRGYEIIF